MVRGSFLNRRNFIGGMACLAAAPAKAGTSPIAHGVLAENSLAKLFETVTTDLPDLSVQGPDGETAIGDLVKGRTVLMPLWAEWCAPCMSELPDFARLQEKYGNDKFAIVPVLTGTHRQFTPAVLRQMFQLAHMTVFAPLIEHRWGDRLVTRMARRDGEPMLPCNLLIAPDGRVVAREIGAVSDSDDTNPAKSYKETLSRVQSGVVQSRWGQADGDDFARAMANGFLT